VATDPSKPPVGRSTVWSRVAWGQANVPRERAPEQERLEEEPWIADQPGVAFDAALLSTAFGWARRPFALRESLQLARAVARRPQTAARPVSGLLAETARILGGSSKLEPWRTDRRYADRAWSGNRLFRSLAQAHAAVARSTDELLDDAGLDPGTDYRLRLSSSNVMAAVAPANFPLLNPAALKAMIDTGGTSLVTGSRRLIEDMRSPPRLPARSEPSEFELGRDLAATPGTVVKRTAAMELIQYRARTPRVRSEPIVVVPSLVNKYYLTDLSPGRSLVEYLLDGGYEVFHLSWINPGPEHRHFDLDTYIAAIAEGIETSRAISRAERVHTIGVCAGGQLLTIALAHLANSGDQEQVASMMLTVAILDHSDPTSPTGLLNRETAESAIGRIERAGLVDGREMAESLAWLRPVDSIWWAWVQRYLLAADIPKMDLFHWSEDTTNLPAALVRDLLELTLDNKLTSPGALEVLGAHVDLGQVKVPAYLLAGRTDNLTPWRSCYRTAGMLGSDCRFVLVNGGHLQAILRPPGGRQAGFRTGTGTPHAPAQWLQRSTDRNGSWWDHYIKWLDRRSSGTRGAPKRAGDDAHPGLGAAPGAYARRRLDD
jgi:polyhydroxyalkanoate synthase subunit PhaC